MHALRVLEYDQVLAQVVAHCETELGALQIVDLKPSFVTEDVWILLDRTEEALTTLNEAPPPTLAPCKDLRDAVKRAGKGGTIGGRESADIGAALNAMRSFRQALEPRLEKTQRLAPFILALPDLRKLEEVIDLSVDSSGDVRSTASSQLTSLRQRKLSTSQRVQERIQSYISGKTRDLLSDPIYTVRDGRYVIPLKAENRGKIKGIVHDTSGSGQTIFVEPDDVLQLGNALREIEAAEQAEIHRILIGLSQRIGTHSDAIQNGLDAVTTLDVTFAKARHAAHTGGTVPIRKTYPVFEAHNARHPLLDRAIAVPISIELGKGKSVLITGPNTGGKTVAIKTVGLFTLMLQSGILPPALEVRFGCFSQVWADIGDEQSLSQSLSTFSGHIKNIATALKSLREGSLVLLDEVGAGTDPAEGAALAKAILNDLSAKGATIMASTHYGELKAFAYETPGFINAAMEFDVKTLRPTYRLRLGTPGASQALRIAERHGIPKDTIDRAREALGSQHQDIAGMLERLEESQKLARQAQGEADRRIAELKKMEEIASRKLAEADEIRRTAHSKAQQIIEDALRDLRLEHADAIDALKSNPQEARKQYEQAQKKGHDLARTFDPPKPKKGSNTAEILKGMSVKVDGYTQTGTVLDDPKDGQVKVQMGRLSMTLPLHSLQPIAHKPTPKAKTSQVKISLQRAMHATTEVSLRNMRFEDAEQELQRFVDSSLLAGMETIRIVHGKGEGILRQMTQNYLRKHPNVEAFRDAEPAEGGQGVTIAVLS